MSPSPFRGPRRADLLDFISGARWFGGKGRGFEITGVESVMLHEGPEPTVIVALVQLGFEDGPKELYQIPLAAYPELQHRLSHALVGVEDDIYYYDAVHDRFAMARWLATFDRATANDTESRDPDSGLVFHRTTDHAFDLESHSTLFSGEQSNSSVAFGDDSLMKLFRRVTPGINPDIEIHAALSRADSQSIAELYGWVDLPTDGEPLQLAMLQQFLRTASDGWDLALASVRNLFAEADLHPDEVGGDFAGEAHRLGASVAEIHELLRATFGEEAIAPAEVAEAMGRRLRAAVGAVPQLAESADDAQALFDALTSLAGSVPTQRVHGDLHLGQTLRTSLGWKLVDFEGEPAKPLAERQLPDSAWRDVAGMLRSLDYAAQTVVHDISATGDAALQINYRATEWRTRNRNAFLEGYAEQRARPLTDDDRILVAAYEADKAVYEVVYEARNRPDWIDIPLTALHRLHDQNGDTA